jgi:hypothetical protein
MADVRLSPQILADTGITPSYTGSLATTNTYKIRNNGHTIVHFKKSAAVACTVTVQTPKTVGGLAVAERTITVAASTGDIMAGPFTPSTYNDSAGDVNITLSDVDGLTVAVVTI